MYFVSTIDTFFNQIVLSMQQFLINTQKWKQMQWKFQNLKILNSKCINKEKQTTDFMPLEDNLGKCPAKTAYKRSSQNKQKSSQMELRGFISEEKKSWGNKRDDKNYGDSLKKHNINIYFITFSDKNPQIFRAA